MLSVIAGNQAMTIALLIVLAVIALNILIHLFTRLRANANFNGLAEAVTLPMLYDVFPLLVLSWLTVIDPTKVLILIWYYVAAVFIVLKTLLNINKTTRR